MFSEIMRFSFNNLAVTKINLILAVHGGKA